MMTVDLPLLPQCWGHRGASAAYPENTIESFKAAIKDGAEGLESDVHLSADNVILMFHDPNLDRTTNGSGNLHNQPYHDGIDQLRTKKAPHQPIPTFAQVIDLIMQPENQHVVFNIDVKPDNEPIKLFTLMKEIISAYPDWETKLAPRLVLGLWHPRYIEPAVNILPLLKRSHIGMSPSIARKYFFRDCEIFSMHFSGLVSRDGQKFLQECKDAGKNIMVWTVNLRNEWIEAVKWGVNVVLTDKTSEFLTLRNEMKDNWSKVSKETSFLLPWSSLSYYSLYQRFLAAANTQDIIKRSGPLEIPNTI